LYAVYAPHDKTTLVLGFAFAIRARRVDPGLNEDLIVTVSTYPVEKNGLLYRSIFVLIYACTTEQIRESPDRRDIRLILASIATKRTFAASPSQRETRENKRPQGDASPLIDLVCGARDRHAAALVL